MKSVGARKSGYTRDVLDEAVRRLAVSPAPIADRLTEAGEALTSGLEGPDFPHKEDRELFDRIALTVRALREQPQTNCEVSEATIEATAQDILDLRDTIMGRAILEAKRSRQD